MKKTLLFLFSVLIYEKGFSGCNDGKAYWQFVNMPDSRVDLLSSDKSFALSASESDTILIYCAGKLGCAGSWVLSSAKRDNSPYNPIIKPTSSNSSSGGLLIKIVCKPGVYDLALKGPYTYLTYSSAFRYIHLIMLVLLSWNPVRIFSLFIQILPCIKTSL